MSEKFSKWDAADNLEDLGDVAAFHEAAFEEAGDDPAFIAQALGTVARSGNISELAVASG